MKRLFIILLIYLTLLTVNIAQQNLSFTTQNSNVDSNAVFNQRNTFNFEASYSGDFVGNLVGGKNTGTLFLGMANIKIGFVTANFGLWNNGEFFINGASTHGGSPSEKLLGDFHVASNIEAGDLTYLHELWYKHTINNFELTIGLQDLNAEFVTSEFAGSFINSSFGIPSLISDNIPVPIFPLTALGLSARYEFSENIALQAAVFDGMPEDFENNRYNLKWELNSNDGVLFISEIHLATNFRDMPGILKAGYYYHSCLRETCPESGIDKIIFDNNYGFYAIADQTIFQSHNNRQLGLFMQIAFSPLNINSHNYYLGGGINYTGVLNHETEDAFGIAFAHAGFKDESLRNETTIEVFYTTKITQNLSLKPDVQYIINPAGTGVNLNNALAAIMRFELNF